MRGLLWAAVFLASLLLMVGGYILAVTAPNGLLGVILCVLGGFGLWAWIEHDDPGGGGFDER